jgi:ectoine hydroxylase-related dioxygenase (phytanoyl-CoA dioxygenase family)
MAIGLPAVHLDPMGSPPTDELVAEAADAFRAAGCLVVHDVLDVELVESLRAAFLARFHRRVPWRRAPESVEVGGRRHMITVPIRPPFADPRVYANPLLLRIVTEVLGAPRLIAFGGVLALPDATEQHLHADGPGLFDDPALDTTLPPFAISTLIPLVDLDDATTGTTQVWPGSHRDSGAPRDTRGFVNPALPRGSVLLTDYRLLHRGTPNPGRSPRPLLYNVYARPWFCDPVNFEGRDPLRIGRITLRRIPFEHRMLFGTAARRRR